MDIIGQSEELQQWFIATPDCFEFLGRCFSVFVETESEAGCPKTYCKNQEIRGSKHGGQVIYRSLRKLLRNVKASVGLIVGLVLELGYLA